MKKIGLLILSVISLNVFTDYVASAQDSKFGDKIKFGVKGGFNLTSFNDEDRVADNNVKPRIGFHIGGLINYKFSDKWSIQPELTYSKEGALFDHPGTPAIPEPYEGKTDFNLINFPVLVQYMIVPGLRIQTGPQFGYAASIKYEDPYNEESDKEDVQKRNISWSIGFSYLTKSGFGIDARYNAGLSNVYKEEFYPGQTALSRAGQLGFFYQFK